MRKRIQLNIHEPCHESWEQMMPAEKGKFCNSCQKNVIDFTTMSDAQLIAFFKKPTNASVCGRFMQDQLDRDIEMPKKRIPWVKYFFQFVIPAFLASSKAVAQGSVMLTGDTIVVANSKKDKIKKSVKETIKTIHGKVTNENGDGIPYASVMIKGTTIGTATDSLGNFSIDFNGIEDSIILTSSCVGFETKETSTHLFETPKTICITLNRMGALGDVVVVSGSGRVMGGLRMVITRTFFDKMLDAILLPKKQMKLYPNPVSRNTALTIEIENVVEGNYFLQLISLSGQVVKVKETATMKGEVIIKLHIPVIPSGTYILQIRNKQSGKIIAEKILVE